jgi:hypothetical protein
MIYQKHCVGRRETSLVEAKVSIQLIRKHEKKIKKLKAIQNSLL